jgi:hypothetical protein
MTSGVPPWGFDITARDGHPIALEYPYQLDVHQLYLTIGISLSTSINYWNPMDIHPIFIIFISGIRTLTLQILPRNGHFPHLNIL